MKNELISIIVPIYNSEKRVGACIESIIKQTYSNIEIILIDDGSTDSSGKVCDMYAQKDDRIIVIHKKNEGVSSSRNMGIEKANGKYIAFIDSDDSINKYYLEKLESCIQTGADIAICDVFYIDRKDDEIRIKSFYTMTLKDFLNGPFLNLKTCHVIGAPFAKLFKSQIVKQIAYEYGENYAEDFVFNLKAYYMCENIGFVAEKLYDYHEENLSSLSKKNLCNMSYIYDRQINTILPIIHDLEQKKECNNFEIEFLVYFIFRDISILFMTNLKRETRYNLFFEIISNKKLKKLKKNIDKCIIERLNTICKLMLKLYIILPGNKIGYHILYMYIKLIYFFAKFVKLGRQ